MSTRPPCSWQMEWELYAHLRGKHAAAELKEVWAWTKRRIETWHTAADARLEFLWVHSFYTAAIQEQERAHMPLVGPTKDRQMLALVAKLANSNTIRSRMCFACDQIFTDVHCWRQSMAYTQHDVHANRSVGEMQLYSFAVLYKFLERDADSFYLTFSLDHYRRNYGDKHPTDTTFAGASALQPGNGTWQCKLRDVAGSWDGWILCNPHDVVRCPECKRRGDLEVCKACQLPLCTGCFLHAVGCCPGPVPASIANDNFWEDTAAFIYQYDVTWLEIQVASPCWNSLLVYYVEGDHGHLLNEQFAQQRWRTRIKGSACSFRMPWEDIVNDLRRNIDDKELLELPRSAETIKYILRVHLKLGRVDFGAKFKQMKASKQLRVRPFIVLRLLHWLIDRNHPVFRDKGSGHVKRGVSLTGCWYFCGIAGFSKCFKWCKRQHFCASAP